MHYLDQLSLRTDISGMPLGWIGFREVVNLHFRGKIAYSSGSVLYSLRSGVSRFTGTNLTLPVSSIVATQGNLARRLNDFAPPLGNELLFCRDGYTCMYCGQNFVRSKLSRDHVTPISRGGLDVWENVVTACLNCNCRKAGRKPHEANLQLLAIPYRPTYAEYVLLRGRNIRADQMEHLLARCPRRRKNHFCLAHLSANATTPPTHKRPGKVAKHAS